jgi:hypothetical protein
MASIVIYHLQQSFPSNEVAILYIYCAYNVHYKAKELVAALLRQLVHQLTALPEYRGPYLQKCQCSDFPISRFSQNHFRKNTTFLIHEISRGITMLSVDLTECKGSIISWSQERMTHADIINNLQVDFGITVSIRTLKRRMKE